MYRRELPRGVVRLMRAKDVPRVMEITRECKEAAQWSEADYAKLAADGPQEWDGKGAGVLVGQREGCVAGFAAVRCVADEMEVLNLGVATGERRHGIGTMLLQMAFQAATNAGAKAAFCEVRESNSGGLAFYGKHGFARAGKRLQYYAHPVEDAIVLRRELDAGIIEEREASPKAQAPEAVQRSGELVRPFSEPS